MVLRSSSKLRKDSEATCGFPQRSVSSSTSSSNLIHRAVSFHCISWFLSIVSSFSSTNTWKRRRAGIHAGDGKRQQRISTQSNMHLHPVQNIHNDSQSALCFTSLYTQTSHVNKGITNVWFSGVLSIRRD